MDVKSFWRAAGELASSVWRQTSAWRRTARMTAGKRPLSWNAGEARSIANELAQFLREARRGAPSLRLEPGETDKLVERIRRETGVWNLNNVTRTQAYWNMYRTFPELHWALLAHMVSRNGGWSMTDLKGEWLPRLLKPETAELHYALLETCNALIFRDAYPQLKLYAESRRRGEPLFGLLPRFGVSAFMDPFWERFWAARDPVLLTVALIANEQNVIQTPVVEDPFYRNHLLKTPAFRAQPWLQTNQLVFPLLPEKRQAERHLPLAGRVLERFDRLDERIRFGKSLYALLFGYPRVLAGVRAFAERVPHTGSRADYWPDLFSERKNGGKSPAGDLSAESLWHSPRLAAAWPDRPLPEPPERDWFGAFSHSLPLGQLPPAVLSWLTAPKLPRTIDMTEEHLLGQRKLQAAAAAPLPRL